MTSSKEHGYALFARLSELRDTVRREGDELARRWEPVLVRPESRESLGNLAHYLALRQRDLRALQGELPAWGLSSLGRSEGRVLQNLDAILATLGTACGAPAQAIPVRPSPADFRRGDELLEAESERVLGPAPDERLTRIMVTMPTEAATDPDLVENLVRSGMDVARINCAHDDVDGWRAMISHVRRASERVARPCRVHMDLAGPKLRTTEVTIPDPGGRLRRGDRLWLGAGGACPPGVAHAGCSAPAVLEHMAVGDEVWFDDGKIGARVEGVHEGAVELTVTSARPKGQRLRAGKGLNLPDHGLRLPALTARDRKHLAFAAAEADSIGLSFVRDSADIELVQDALVSIGRRLAETPLIVKVETAEALENLPEIIARGTGRQPFGLMIARGDLAVEIGFLRLAEIQEELLWLAEAAHVPVVWATQVLERVVKKGRPSRGEVTDAAMGERAECVMLNKGRFIADGVKALSDVLRRMQGHMHKKTPLLRALKSWPLPRLSQPH